MHGRGPNVDWNSKTVAFVVAAVLVVAGIGLLLVTEESGEAGSGASGGTSDQSDDLHPYLWHGIAVLVLGLAVGAWGWTQAEDADG